MFDSCFVFRFARLINIEFGFCFVFRFARLIGIEFGFFLGSNLDLCGDFFFLLGGFCGLFLNCCFWGSF